MNSRHARPPTLVRCPSIMVVRRTGSSGDGSHELVDGWHRLNAYIALGRTAVHAIVINPMPEECLTMRPLEPLPRRPMRRGH